MSTEIDIVERLRSSEPLPVCPYDRLSPQYWTAPNDKPCPICGQENTTEGPDKCRGADTRIMGEAADLITKLRAERAWRPIETAPKDGTPIIGAFWSIRWADSHRKGDIVRCWWQSEFEAFISSCREMHMHNGCTFSDGSTRRLHSPAIEPVTHWMPLPAPPEVQP